MSYLTEHAVQRILAPYEAELYDVMFEAWRLWEIDRDNSPILKSNRTRASSMHDAIVQLVVQRFGGRANVRLLTVNQLFVMQVGSLVVRFKKLNEEGGASCNPTAQTRMFNSQGQLPGVPDQSYVYVGYNPNRVGSAVQDVLVSLYDDGMLLWTYEIQQRKAAIIPMSRQAPVQPPLAAADEARKKRTRFHAEADNDEKKKEEGDDGAS